MAVTDGSQVDSAGSHGVHVGCPSGDGVHRDGAAPLTNSILAGQPRKATNPALGTIPGKIADKLASGTGVIPTPATLH